MRIPVIRGVIDRRILVNYRVDPEVLAKLLPAPFRPEIVHGQGLAGICLIRLKEIRPRLVPAVFGMHSENAAYRIAVEWQAGGMRHRGVFIPRRESSSRLNCLLGGRLFPGAHHHAQFQVDEAHGKYRVELRSADGWTDLVVEAHTAGELRGSIAFSSLEEASAFFQRGSLGYSPVDGREAFDGLELKCDNWEMQPLEVQRIESSFFDDRRRFPAGSAVFDSALLMRHIQHEWHGTGRLQAEAQQVKVEPCDVGS